MYVCLADCCRVYVSVCYCIDMLCCAVMSEEGGWALVYKYTFNYYDDFDAGSNYVEPIPSWHDSGNWTGNTDAADSTISTDPPLDPDEYGALVSE